MIPTFKISENVSSYFAGFLFLPALCVLALVFPQAFVGGLMLGQALDQAAISPFQGLAVIIFMATYLSWLACRAVRGLSFSIRFYGRQSQASD